MLLQKNPRTGEILISRGCDISRKCCLYSVSIRNTRIIEYQQHRYAFGVIRNTYRKFCQYPVHLRPGAG